MSGVESWSRLFSKAVSELYLGPEPEHENVMYMLPSFHQIFESQILHVKVVPVFACLIAPVSVLLSASPPTLLQAACRTAESRLRFISDFLNAFLPVPLPARQPVCPPVCPPACLDIGFAL